MIKIVEKEKAF